MDSSNSPNSPTLPGSGSIQSHLSKANQRIRPTSLTGSLGDSNSANALPKHTHDLPVQPQSYLTRRISSKFFGAHLSDLSLSRPVFFDESLSIPKRLYHWMFFCAKIILVFYCLFSLFFAPVIVYLKVMSMFSLLPNVESSFLFSALSLASHSICPQYPGNIQLF
ncbi:hypothetical protein GYMLUDRAFT_865038 [Collybiopsis luxurians FD-317 M1]|nr:hypothetical protein GYMLUDRAFT_865038 [Collybiopsis luxurians FD-317 M1]